MQKNKFMELALDQAKIAFKEGEVPVGAVIVESGEVIALGRNQNRTLGDPTAHAEIVALRQACEIKGSSRLDGCDLYVTLEPCAMCSGAVALARIRGLYYGSGDEKFGAVEGGVRFFASESCFHRPEIYSGICEIEARELMRNFFANLR